MTYHSTSTSSPGAPATPPSVRSSARVDPLPNLGPAARLAAALMLALATIGAGLGASLAAAPAALAHDQLISSNPADGDVLAEAPAAVELVFSAELMDLGNEVRIEDADGAEVPGGELRLQRETLTRPLPALEDGAYQVTWRAVSSDGHPIAGTFSFSIGNGSGSADATGNADAGDNAGDASEVREPAEGTAGADAPSGTGAGRPEDREDTSGVPGWIPAAGVGAVVGLGLYGAAVWLRRRFRS